MERTPALRRPLFLLPVALLFVAGMRPVAGNPRDVVSGCFYFYDYALDKQTDQPGNQFGVGQAKLIEGQEHIKLLEWNNGGGRCLCFSPAKKGDSVSFRIHIGQTDGQTAYFIQTGGAVFGDEGIYQLLVDDQPVGPEHDCLGREMWDHGNLPVEPGDYKITYRYTGQNPKSNGVALYLRTIAFHWARR